MKRILSLILVLAMMLAMGACAGAETTETAAKTTIRVGSLKGPTTMGIVKTIRHLRDYEGEDENARKLGQRLLETQESNVEKMKAYL